MSNPTFQHNQCIEWSMATRALPGQDSSGDLHLVVSYPDGVLIAVVDGLGHGSEASAASQVAVDVLKAHPGESLITLMKRCNDALKSTRGAVITLVSIDVKNEMITALGVGNVEAVLLRANQSTNPPREGVLLRGGVVGYQLPALHADMFAVHTGDLLIFATDGIQDDFYEDMSPAEPVQHVAGRILAQKFRGTDDALVLAIRYLGKPHG